MPNPSTNVRDARRRERHLHSSCASETPSWWQRQQLRHARGLVVAMTFFSAINNNLLQRQQSCHMRGLIVAMLSSSGNNNSLRQRSPAGTYKSPLAVAKASLSTCDGCAVLSRLRLLQTNVHNPTPTLPCPGHFPEHSSSRSRRAVHRRLPQLHCKARVYCLQLLYAPLCDTRTAEERKAGQAWALAH